jgi:hypothetical protein
VQERVCRRYNLAVADEEVRESWLASQSLSSMARTGGCLI